MVAVVAGGGSGGGICGRLCGRHRLRSQNSKPIQTSSGGRRPKHLAAGEEQCWVCVRSTCEAYTSASMCVDGSATAHARTRPGPHTGSAAAHETAARQPNSAAAPFGWVMLQFTDWQWSDFVSQIIFRKKNGYKVPGITPPAAARAAPVWPAADATTPSLPLALPAAATPSQPASQRGRASAGTSLACTALRCAPRQPAGC